MNLMGSNGCTQNSCVVYVPTSYFTNLRYGDDNVSLVCGLPAEQVCARAPTLSNFII
jgi:hypothetical protein